MQLKYEIQILMMTEHKIGFLLELPSPFITKLDTIMENDTDDEDENPLKFDTDKDNDPRKNQFNLLSVFTYTDIIDDFDN